MQLLSLAAFVVWLRNMAWGRLFAKETADCEEEPEMARAKQEAGTEQKGNRKWIYIFGVLAAVLVLIQAYIPARDRKSVV